MSTPAWLQALRDLRNRSPTQEDLDPVIAEILADKNDRGAALIASGLVEGSLEDFIKSRLVPLNSTEMSRLFGMDAPLSSFGDQIKVAYAFGLISAEVRSDLDRLREIRNTFAHSRIAISFQGIAAACDGFHADWRHYKDMPHNDEHPHTKFVGSASQLMKLFGDGRRTQGSLPLQYDHLQESAISGA